METKQTGSKLSSHGAPRAFNAANMQQKSKKFEGRGKRRAKDTRNKDFSRGY